MKKSIIILLILLLLILSFIYFIFLKNVKQDKKLELNNVIQCEEIVNKIENAVITSEITENSTKEESKEQKKSISKVNEIAPKTEITQPKDSIASETSNSQDSIPVVKNPSDDITIEPEVTIPEVTEELKNGYFYNESESQLLLSEFKRITNNDSNFTVRIDKKAKNSNPFWPYKESEIQKQIGNMTFGYFIVYSEDYYKDGVKQRTLYYITFDV